MISKQFLQACAAAACFLTISSALPGQQPDSSSGKVPPLTITQVVRDLEAKAGKLAKERSTVPPHTDENKAAAGESDTRREDASAAFEISGCLMPRANLAGHNAVPSDPYYQAIRQQLLAGIDLETAVVWWRHCRKGTAYESLDRFEQLPLAAELKATKDKADQSVAASKPALDSAKPETPGKVPLNSSLTTRLNGGKGILDQIVGWKNLPEESKSKIIAR